MRFGLCCKFLEEPIKFRTATATHLLSMPRKRALAKISEICLHNAAALRLALEYCRDAGIGAFRVNSQILPIKTHPAAGYDITELPRASVIQALFKECGEFAAEHDVRTMFHPDQFVVLSSVDEGLTQRSIKELAYQCEVAEWIGADVVNVHGGGAYGDKASALARVEANILSLPREIRQRLTLENDERVYTPMDLLPVCNRTGTPLVYDVHHHRCFPDGISVAEATRGALTTWNREPVFHISSPKNGWEGTYPQRHHDFIDPQDFPHEWLKLNVTVEVEAKAKERAVLRLMRSV